MHTTVDIRVVIILCNLPAEVTSEVRAEITIFINTKMNVTFMVLFSLLLLVASLLNRTKCNTCGFGFIFNLGLFE